MADRTINGLTAIQQSALSGASLFPVWDAGNAEARKTTFNQLASKVGGAGLTSIKDDPYNATGDGATDDTAAFKAAMNAGGGFLVPAGRYLWSTMSTFTNNNFTRFYGTGSRESVIVIDTGDNLNLDAGIVFENIKFEGSGTLIQVTSQGGSVGAIEFIDCTFDGLDKVLGSNNNSNINTLNKIRIYRCTAQNLGDSFVALFGGQIKDTEICDNRIDGGTTWGIKVGFIKNDGTGNTFGDIERVKICGNFIRDIHGGTSTSQMGAINVHGEWVVIANNVCQDVDNDGNDTEGIYIKVTYGVIANNVVRDCGISQGMIALKGGGHDFGSVPKWGNIVANNIVVSTRTDVQSDGMWIQNSDVTIIGNQLYGFRGYAISCQTSENYRSVRIVHNLFQNIHAPLGVRVKGRFVNTDISHNIFEDFDLDAGGGTLDIIDLGGANARRIKVTYNIFDNVNPAGTVNGIKLTADAGGTVEDIDFVGNFFGDMDNAFNFIADANINRVGFFHNSSISGGYTKSGASAVQNVLKDNNRNLASLP